MRNISKVLVESVIKGNMIQIGQKVNRVFLGIDVRSDLVRKIKVAVNV